MDQEIYQVALKSALTEIQKVCEGIKWSFILTRDGTIISSDDNAIGSEATKVADSFHSLTEKAEAIGGLDRLLIDAEKGKIYVSSIDDNYLVSGVSKKADVNYMRSFTGVVFPTIFKVLKSIGVPSGKEGPTPLKPLPSRLPEGKPAEAEKDRLVEPSEDLEKAKPAKLAKPQPSQQLIVDKLGGLLVRADTVQIDSELLNRWSSLLDVKKISEVEIETFGGKTARCKVKTISDSRFEGKGLIRIPEKTCQMLEIRRGELVRVKPIVQER
jgi:predicted regulator of Ras-like GTPase activity (Roadblock/LC7/MglB family)